MSWGTTLLISLAWSGVLSALILMSLHRNPRIWLHDFPKAIRESVTEKTEEEQKLARTYGLLFGPIFVGVPIVTALYYSQEPALQIFLHIFVMAVTFNLIDLLIVDWLLICRLTPNWVVIPGTSEPPIYDAYKDYWFHFVGFLKGIVISAIVAATVVCVALAYRFLFES